MKASIQKENWKTVDLNLDFETNYKLEISNLGNVRSSNEYTKHRLLNGSMINGYKVIKLKFLKPRAETEEKKFITLNKQCANLKKKLNSLESTKKNSSINIDLNIKYKNAIHKIQEFKIQDNQNRVVYKSCLVHRLVALYFIKPQLKTKQIVAHLDFNKLNNCATNLQWMDQKEITEHNLKNPSVIKGKQNRLANNNYKPNSKLTIKKVANIKKLLSAGNTLKALSEKYNVSDMQIYRIKTGENWANVPAEM